MVPTKIAVIRKFMDGYPGCNAWPGLQLILLSSRCWMAFIERLLNTLFWLGFERRQSRLLLASDHPHAGSGTCNEQHREYQGEIQSTHLVGTNWESPLLV